MRSRISTFAGIIFVFSFLFSAQGQTLGEALNATNLTWITSGQLWTAQTGVSHADGLAAMSGSVASGQSSILQTTVTGPGTVTFWWRASATLNPVFGNSFRFSANSNVVATLFIFTTWLPLTVYLGEGT